MRIFISYNRYKIFKEIIDTKYKIFMQKSISWWPLKSHNEINDEQIKKDKADELIIQSVIYWLKTDNISFFNNIFADYRMKIELITLDVQKVIVQSFFENLQNGKQINYIFDKINCIEILTANVFTEVSIVLDYILSYNPLSLP